MAHTRAPDGTPTTGARTGWLPPALQSAGVIKVTVT